MPKPPDEVFKPEPSTALVPDEPKTVGLALRSAIAALPRCVEVLTHIINDPTQYGNTRVAAIKELREWATGDLSFALREMSKGEDKEGKPQTPFEALTNEERLSRARQVLQMMKDEEEHILTDTIEMVPADDGEKGN